MSKSIKMIASCAAAATISVFGAAAAQAQVPTVPTSQPFTVKLGVYLPTSSDQKDFAGDTHFDLGVSYEFGKTLTASPLVYGAYLDYIFESSKTFTQFDGIDEAGNIVSSSVKGKSSGFDIGAQARYFFGAPGVAAPIRPYAGLGVGFYSSKDKVSGDTFFSASNTDSGIGGKLMAGVEFKQGFLGELSYNLFPGDNKFDGVGINVGYRF